MKDYIENLPLIDTHMHRISHLREPDFGQIAGGVLSGPNQHYHSRQRILFGVLVDELRKRFAMPETAPSLAVEEERVRRVRENPRAYYQSCFEHANVAMYCIETGSPLRSKAFLPDEIDFFDSCIPEESRSYILRIERFADELLPAALRFEEFEQTLRERLAQQVRAQHAVALKSAIAYYAGLNLQIPAWEDAKAAYEKLLGGAHTKADEHVFYTHTLMLGCEVAAECQIPFGMWYHLPHADQDPVLLAETQVRLAQNLELDFIKLMPFGNFQASDFGLSCDYFCTPNDMVFERKFAIEDVKEWGELKELPGSFGNHGKTLMIAQQVKKHLKKKEMPIPFVQTIFSPLTIAKKLAGPRVFTDLREHPEYVHHALDVMTKTCINFVKENLDVGVAGFFFATQCSTYDFLTEEEYIMFGRAYDLKVIDAFKDQTWFNIMHIHGDNTMYKLMADYPLQCVNWHDRWAKPNLAEARELTDRCLMGGINEKWLKDATIPQVHQHLKQAVDMAGRNGLILTPGCVAATNTPMKNYIACRDAVKKL